MFDKSFIKTVRDQFNAIGKQIDQLTEHRNALATLLKAHGDGVPTKPSAKPKAKPAPSNGAEVPAQATSTAPASPTGQRKGYVNALLPFLFGKVETSATAMYEYLKSLPGNEGLKRNSLDATVQNELKKGANARIARVRPGVYTITDPGITFLNTMEGVGRSEGEPEQQVEAQPGEEAVAEVPVQRF